MEEYLPTQQILRNIFKNPLVLYNSGVLWWDIEDGLEFQDKLEPGCTMEGAQQNVVRSTGFRSDRSEFKSQLTKSPAVTLSELPNLSETVAPSVKWEQQETAPKGL